ncbi:MAG: hypothetical protein K2K93_10715 [Muribaculaceae bacterium]|nr:hypothetical protein [Muribaculaceae bacterium]
MRLATNKNEQVTWFTNGAGTATGLESYGIRYTNYNITADGLVLNPQFTTKEIINNIPFKLGKLYNAQFDINAPEGKYLVTLGDQSQEINISEEDTPGEDGFVHKTVEFGSITDDNGSLTIMPLQYVGSLQLRNGEVASYITDVDAGDMIGTDFFTVQLGDNYTMESGKNYFFHIGYVPTVSEGAFCTPRKFLIKWSTDGTNYQNLGTYEVGEGDNGNAYIGTVNDPIRNIPNGTRSLRFYCLENNADKTAICFDNKENYVTKDENGQINPTAGYIGYMMRLTRFAIYRQDEIIDPQGATTNTWALPLLTRFQIEANGQKYAYPGARLRDMIGIHKGYSNTAELFGLDTRYITEGYWDTTLPYNQQVGVAAEGGMNRDYEDDKIESPYDCIDLLLPDLNKLRATSNQIYVSMAQAKGTIENTYPVYRTYENTVEDRFLDKSNGFPTEIMYQGFITKADGTKELQGDAIVMNLFTFPETIVNNNNTINYNVANFALTIGEGWDGVRIWCRENVGDLERIHGKKTYELKSSPDNRYHTVYQENIYDSEVEPNTRMMRFAIIQAYVEIPKIHLEGDNPYPYHLLYNSRENFEDITWNHTRGIIADINNDGYMKKSQDGKHTWQDVIDDNKADLEKHDIALPNFNFYDSPFDDPYVTVTKDDGYTEKGKRQRTYTILHEVQVLPGERVDLYPQSDIWKTYKDLINKDFGDGSGINYEEQFVRWYDYLTDDAPDYLYFFSEPKSVIKTNDFGFIGGKTLLDHEQRGLGTVASVYFKQSDLDAFNKSGEESNIYFKKVNGETRLKDQYVAADFSLTFNTNLAKRLGKDATTWAGTTTTIEEPIITFRHLFHLVSGKTFADENMADAKGNRDYYINNRRYLTSFGDKDFMIRLEKDMPEEKDTKSAYYYKDSEDTDNAYKRVRGYEIRTYKIDNYTDIDDEQTTELSYNGIAITAGNLGGDKDMFKPTERSIFSHISSDIQTDVDQAKWLKNGKNFYRAIGCDKDDINPGTYMVRIYGKDASGAIITLPGSNGSSVPLVIAEYQITFLDPAKYEASFESEETLNGKDASKTKEENEKNAKNYYTHTEDYLEGHFNKDGKSSLVVNFDNYKYLKDPKYSSYEFFKEANRYNGDTKTLAASYLKLPIAWDDSNYGFGYTTRGDYNMFVLGDHSVITPYKDAADAKKDNPVDIETGVAYTGTYDRLFYNSEGTEKGLFYYVNAASDPGDMAKIQFGELCPGSTIYVSAWVNEFNNGQEETANVIFNFYANISNKTDKTHKIIRQDQIHGFVTGYIDRGTYISQGNTNNYRDGDQGKWMHVYYTFVPDLDRAQYTGDEEVLSYTLVLENNCISSSGADYAIDDIRAYVVEPRVEARQSTPVCNRDHPDDIEVEVMIPFASLYETLKDVIDDKTEIMQLQYSVLDKKVYDEYVTTHKNDANQTGVYQQAFSNSVLHYPHDNIQRSPETDKDKPLSWGTIEFLANFKDYFVYDKDGNITTDDNGNPVKSDKAKTVGSEGQMIDEEEMLVFKTKIHSSDEKQYNDDFDPNHRDYYIVIGNLGTTGLFEDVVGKENSDNKYNADVYPSQTNDGKFVKPTDENNNWEKYDKVLAAKYDFGSKCVRISEFTLKGASDIIVDGIVYNDVDNITCCENQRPVVQIDLYKMDKDKNIDKSTPPEDNKLRANPYIDWYYGSYEKFMEETMDNTTISLWQVITIFRKEYPVATTWDVEVPKGEFTQQMKDYLKTMCEPKQETVTKDGKTVTVTRPAKVQLHTSSFIFPELTLKDEFGETLKDAQGHILTSREVYVTAIPDANLWEDNPWAIVCTEPTEIKITVSNTSPEMLNGFGSGITYPKDMNVVPLRSGLVHLDKTGIDGGEWKLDEYTTTEKDNKPLNISAYENQQTLVIPLRNLAVATQGVKQFKHIESDPYCYLAETNDPYYRRLGQVTYVRPMSVSTGSGETGNDTPATQAETDEAGKLYDSEFGLTPRGVITLDAATTDNHFSNVKITFNKTDMKFHEGYYYTFKFAYEEDYSTDGVQKPAIKEDEPCKGQTLFTIKVVPEYQKWTGDASLNWNNDENWKRVTKDDLLVAADKNVPSGKTANDYRFTINDDDISNENEFAYAPLDFTKVIIPAGATYPQLAARQHDRTGTTGGNISIKNGHGNAAVSYVWAAAVADTPDSNAPKAATATGNESAEDATETAPSYLPTRYVQYDMAAVMYPAGTSYEPNVYCRPWYANACEQIHFNSNAEILNQQNLDYQKAWVDMEMKPDQWYNVASPLYGVVAGDMYLPTQGARQQTELFTDITFDTAVNDRFHPAVFQRGWDKGNETVYNIEGAAFPGCPKVETVALASTWSHVYNDVADQYKVGTGYSVKTDVSRYEDVATNTKFDGLVKFRFPKADIDYDYYTDKNESHRENGTSVNRTDKHKLYSFANNGQVTLTKATDGNLFLVGNPFMAHLDMAKFLEKNKNVITPKYWLLSEGEGQVGVVMDRKNETAMLTNETLTAGDNITATSSTGGKLPPMQGFFVQATNKGKNLTLTFTPDMMAVEAYTDNAGNPLIKAPAHGTRAADDDDIISVTTGESTAIIRLSADAEKGYAASEDVEMIDDSNQRGMRRIYTTAGTMAAAINQTPDADGVEVGLMAPADSVTMVTFNGAALEDYLLYDTATGEMTQLFDGFELEMKGNVSGRYFLTSGIDTKEIEDGTIRIVPARREVVVTAPAVCGDLTVRVYDTLGREIATAEGFSEEVRIALDPGIYVIDASGSEKGHKAAKISIR